MNTADARTLTPGEPGRSSRGGLIRFALLAVAVLVTFTLAGCGGDDTSAAEKPAATTASPDEASEAPDAENDPAHKATGRLTLDGESLVLTQADETEAACLIVGQTAIVSQMLTPAGHRVDLKVQEIPKANVSATLYDGNVKPLRTVMTDLSSKAPEWSIEGSTVRVKGLWNHRTDPSQPEVEGEVEVTC